MNKVMLIGNVGVDPEIRYVDQGVAVARVRLATTRFQIVLIGIPYCFGASWPRLWRSMFIRATSCILRGASAILRGMISRVSVIMPQRYGQTIWNCCLRNRLLPLRNQLVLPMCNSWIIF